MLPPRLLKPIARAVIALLCAQCATPFAHAAGVVPDSAAPSGKKPILDAATNGVPIVNIAPPNAQGLSHNLYTQFDVAATGLILNNSASARATQLGGTIRGNPQLGTTAARLILNEVTASTASTLNGKLEVAGAAADVVLANPSGIVCDGCGFVNTTRATLTTGRPQLSDGALAGLTVGGGAITVSGSGINAASLPELDLLARVVKIDNAPVSADGVFVIAGRNKIAYADLNDTPLAAASTQPTWGIDLGWQASINANQIFLRSTEKGVGINSRASVTARTGGLTLAADGRVELGRGTRSATGGAVAISGSTITQTSGSTSNSDGLVLMQATDGVSLAGTQVKGSDVMIASGGNVSLDAATLDAGTDLRVRAENDITMRAGSASAGGQLAFVSGGDLKLSPGTASSTVTTTQGSTTTVTTTLANRRPTLNAGAGLTLQAQAGIVNLDGAALASTGNVVVQGQSVSLFGAKDSVEQSMSTPVDGGYDRRHSLLEKLQHGGIAADGDVALLATGEAAKDKGDILVVGSKVDSGNGQVTLLAARDLDISNDVTRDESFSEYYQRKHRWFSTKTTYDVHSDNRLEVQPSEVSGRSISLGAGHDLSLVASIVTADGAIGMHADHDLNLLSTAEIRQSYSLHEVKKSGIFGSGGFGITIGSQSRTEVNNSRETQQIGTSVASLVGDVFLTAGNQYLQLSSDITAPVGDVNIAAREVAIQTNNNTLSVLNSIRTRQSGLTLSASHPLVTLGETAVDGLEASRRTENPRLKALALLTSGLTVYNAFGDLAKTQTTASDVAKSPWTFNLSLGYSATSFDSVYKSSLPQESVITAGRDLNITATGSGADGQGDISVIGSALTASGNTRLHAEHDISLLAAIGTTSEQTRTSASSGAIGIALNSAGSPVSATLAVSRTRGFTNGWGTTYFPTELTAGQALTLESGRNTGLQGATVSGASVVGRVGTSGAGDLTIATPQDESHFIAKEQTLGTRISIPIGGGVPSLGITYNQLKLLADWQSAREQTAIRAGAGGFDISVNGHTHLNGGAIASRAGAGLNRLTTQTLTYENLLNHDNASGSSSALTLDFGSERGKGALAGSSYGYAQIDRATLGHTLAAIAPATITLTQPTSQAAHREALRASQRAPLVEQLGDLRVHLQWLLDHEPPPCDTCAPYGTTPDIPATTQATGSTDNVGAGNDTHHRAWVEAVATNRARIARMEVRIDAVDHKTYGTLATLSRDPNASHKPLAPTFDPRRATEELKLGAAITAGFSKTAFKTAGDFAQGKLDDAERKRQQAADPNNGLSAPQRQALMDAADKLTAQWQEGGPGRTALHAIVGGLAFGTAGAIGATANQLAQPLIAEVTAGISDAALRDVVRAAASTAISAGVAGGSGASAGFNADANNRQLHPREVERIQSEARNFARQLKGGAEPTQAEVNAAEKRLAQQAYRMVQFGASGADDLAAGSFLKALPKELLPGDPNAPGQTVGYMFWADPIQKSNPNMYADAAMSSAATMAFYVKNGLVPPSSAQILAAVAKDSDARKALLNSTNMAGIASALLIAPPAVSWCLSNPIRCNRMLASTAEIASGDALGPMGLGVAGWAGVKAMKTAEELNAVIKAGGGQPAWSAGSAVIAADLQPGTRIMMIVDDATATAIDKRDLRKLGGWATFDDVTSVAVDMRQRLAILEEFKRTVTGPFHVVELELTRAMPSNIGFVGALPGAPGGATQIELLIDRASRADYFKVVTGPTLLKQ